MEATRVSEIDNRLARLLDIEVCPAGLDVHVAKAREELEYDGNHAEAAVILLEGLDGVGKTTAAKNLSSQLNARLLKTPPACITPWRKYFDEREESTRRIFYEMGNILLSRELRLAKPDEVIVLDRYW